MLLEFSCSNFKSIRDKVVFSTVGTDDGKNEEFLRKFDDFRVLHTSVIYGPNGAGKSNLFKAIEFMKDLVLTSCENGEGQVLSQPRHKMAAKDEPSEFNMQFLMGDLRYAYGFVLCENLVSEEYLYYFCGEKVVEVFERVGGEVWLGDKFGENEVLLEIINDKLGDNKLLLSCIGDNTDIGEISDAFLFFKLHIVVQNMEDNNKEDCIRAMITNEEMRQLIVSTFRELDSDIKDVKVEYPRVKVVYDEFETDLFEEESTGIQKLFYLVLPIVESFINGKVMLVDEIEVSLHRNVAYEIIKLFNTSIPQSSAQLIFTSHDISLLSSNLFRKDQIWFAQLGKDRATDLYSLAEIKNVRADENIAKGYVMGKYGAIPV
ncbi:MAG: ATP-binding protein, partial [Intestinibacter bartlettii]|uniref:AAA family ATPase n=1 Tax=Intestinibacter bartlettii TaxID=261299 RepID=UPI0026EF7EA9